MRQRGAAQAVDEMMVPRNTPLIHFAFRTLGYFDVRRT
jgi:hypothetical protein